MTRCPALLLLLAAGALAAPRAGAQDGRPAPRVGVGYGRGTQQAFPYDNHDYRYTATGYKLLVNFPLAGSGAFSYELQLEPSIYAARHRLLNQYYVQPGDGPDYLQQRERFTRGQSITEYALNVGVVVRYHAGKQLSLFALGSTGPMFSDTATERLARGLAFSDLAACGLGYLAGRVMLEVRVGLRHVSNAELRRPNSGHNSSNLDLSWSYAL